MLSVVKRQKNSALKCLLIRVIFSKIFMSVLSFDFYIDVNHLVSNDKYTNTEIGRNLGDGNQFFLNEESKIKHARLISKLFSYYRRNLEV
mgnify:CR=1 FL=1